MNKTISTFIFAAVVAIFTFSTSPALACPGVPSCTKCGSSAEKHVEKKVEKKCKEGCTKPCCAKKNVEKKCKKAEAKKKCHKSKAKPSHEDSSRYND